MSGRTAACIGLGAAVPVLGAVVALFHETIRPAQEIDRYADHIREAGLAISKNLEGLEELERTQALTGAVPDLALAYLRKLGAA